MSGLTLKHCLGIIVSSLCCAVFLSSCSFFNLGNMGSKKVPHVKLDTVIGKRMLWKPGAESGRVFNGDFNLGTAGWALKYYVKPEYALKKNIPYLTTVERENGKGMCLKAPSIPGADYYWLAGREVYLKKDMKIRISYEAKMKKTPDSSDIKTFFLDFRNFNRYRPGMTTRERYWLNSIWLNLSEKWQTKNSKVLTIPRDGYYFFRFVIVKRNPDKPMPEIYIDSVKIEAVDGKKYKCMRTLPEVAIYENKEIPAYMREDTISYTIKSSVPNDSKVSERKLYLDIIDDQFFTVEKTVEVSLSLSKNNIYEGSCSFSMPRYGSYSTRVRDENGILYDSFGGDFVVIHPVPKTVGKIASGVGINSQTYKFFKEYGNQLMFYIVSKKISNYFDVLRLAGIKDVREWNYRWKIVEPEKGKFDFTATDIITNEYLKRNINITATLGVCFAAKEHKVMLNLPSWLLPLCGKHKVTPKHSLPAYVPPFNLWENYCYNLMKHYRDKIKVWEVFNEPNQWMSPENNLEYVKAAARAADRVAPDIKVIGPCPTGDFATERFAGWSKEFIALNGEKYIDGFSYHPYGASNDFQHGKLFEASNTIKSIRSWLKNKSMPLYNTECYHFPNALRMRTTQAEASPILRHYLITLGHGVIISDSISDEQIFKYRLNSHVALDMCHNMESVPAPVAAALNNLTYQLRNADRAYVMHPNKFVETYLFVSGNGKKAVAALWDLRPTGSTLISKASSYGLKFTDMWGNPLNYSDTGITLTFDPVYIIGKIQTLKKFIAHAEFRLSCPVEVRGRFFSKDLYLNAKNLSGMSFRPEISFPENSGLKLPESVQFAFAGNFDCTVRIPNARQNENSGIKSLPFEVKIKNTTTGKGKISFLSPVKCFNIPEKGMLSVKLSEGTVVKFGICPKGLKIKISVKDSDIIAPLSGKPWTGDAVEIFIDRAPFSRLERDIIRGGGEKLSVCQYIIPAKPASPASSLWQKDKSLSPPLTNVNINAIGYTVDAVFPWQSLASSNRYGIYGIDIEIDHVDKKGGKVRKETLSGKSGISFKQRLHYPLFKIPMPDNISGVYYKLQGFGCIKNGSFEIRKSDKDEPAGWRKSWERKPDKCRYGKAYGYADTKGVCVMLKQPEERHIKGWSQQIKCLSDSKRGFIIEGMVKMQNVKIIKPNKGGSGLKLFVHFYNENKKQHMDNIGIGVREDIVGSTGWRILQCPVFIPHGATRFQITCGLSKGVIGTVFFDNIHVKNIK